MHRRTVDDEEGQQVCIDCCLVLQQSFFSTEQQQQQTEPLQAKTLMEEEEGSDERKTKYFFLDICSNAHIPPNIATLSTNYYKKLQKKLAGRVPKFKNKQIAAYALYETLSNEGISRSVQEVSYYTDCTESKIWAVESVLNIEKTLSSPLDFVERYCVELGLNYSDILKIKQYLDGNNALKYTRPQCAVAVAIYTYCKQQSNKILLKDISKICSVSTANIHSLMRKCSKEKK
jgi:transcription initiation factor TFIIIB Brf1 subunit/transcription initiation factor TFIIB